MKRPRSIARQLCVFGLVAVLASVASADTTYADFETTAGSLTSNFLDDYLGGTGELRLEGGDVTVDRLRADPVVSAPGSGDAMFGADVTAIIGFDSGAWDGTASDVFRIASSDGTKVYLEGSVYSATFAPGAEIFAGSGIHTWSGTIVVDPIPSNRLNVDNLGNPLAAADRSQWVETARQWLELSGLRTILLFGLNDPPPGTSAGDVTYLDNVTGKLVPNPEPGTLALVGACLLGGLLARRRKTAA